MMKKDGYESKNNGRAIRLRCILFCAVMMFGIKVTEISAIAKENETYNTALTDGEETLILPEELEGENFEEAILLPGTRAAGDVGFSVSANASTKQGEYNLKKDKTFRFDLTYYPSNSISIGLVQPDGSIRTISRSAGKVDYTFTIKQNGKHNIYVKNNSGSKVTFTGKVYY